MEELVKLPMMANLSPAIVSLAGQETSVNQVQVCQLILYSGCYRNFCVYVPQIYKSVISR